MTGSANRCDPLLTPLDESKAESIIRMLYRVLLNREADSGGLWHKTQSLLNGTTLSDQIKAFILSPEFAAKGSSSFEDALPIEWKIEEESLPIVTQLFDKSSEYWRMIADRKDELYFSVITDNKYKKQLSTEERKQFLHTGKRFVDFCIMKMRSLGLGDLQNKKCLDFGCGVGRLTLNLASNFKKVFAVDFSKAHIGALQDNKRQFFTELDGRVETIYLDTIYSLDTLPKVSGIISFITLQHNPPPVMAYILRALLDVLVRGGIACIHIPIYHPFYKFDTHNYLENPLGGRDMEMHILPRANIEKIADESGCVIAESTAALGGTRGIYSEVFVFKKVATRKMARIGEVRRPEAATTVARA
jgi:SAM-dependent methyltransferase